MKRTESPSRINAVAAVKINMTLEGSSGELAIEATSALMNDKQPGSLGKSQYIGPWPEEVTLAASQLRSAIEDHLLRVYFEVGDDGPRAAGTGAGGRPGNAGNARKQGIVEPPMERPADDPPQL
jgi:hypothetical protein